MERDVVVSIYQGVCREGDFAANAATVREVTEAALQRGSDFLCFPECFLSGYESPEAVRAGARSLGDEDLQAVIAETSAHDMAVLVGTARRAPDGLFNTQLVMHRGRLLGWYDKVFLTGGDSDRLGFMPGRAVPTFEAHGTRFAVQICHDSSFPHVALHAKLRGAEVLFSPHNNEIGVSAADDHRKWVRNNHVGTACQMKLVVARANIVKSDRPDRTGYGDSFILSPQGEPLAEAGLFRTALITATIAPRMFGGPYVWADFAETPAWLRAELAELLVDWRGPGGTPDPRAEGETVG